MQRTIVCEASHKEKLSKCKMYIEAYEHEAGPMDLGRRSCSPSGRAHVDKGTPWEFPNSLWQELAASQSPVGHRLVQAFQE